MLNKDFLLDDFHLTGKCAEDFKAAVEWIDEHTYNLLTDLKDLTVISLLANQYQDEAPQCLKACILQEGNPWVRGAQDTFLPMQAFMVAGMLPDILPDIPDDQNTSDQSCMEERLKALRESKMFKELIHKNRTILKRQTNVSRDFFHLSAMAIPTLAQRLGVTSAAIEKRCLASDILIAELLHSPKACTLIIKHFRGVGKIVAVMSDSYAKIKLRELWTVASDLSEESKNRTATGMTKKLGPMVCEGWDITHERCSISFSFPEYAKEVSEIYHLPKTMIPCVELMTSDMGECAFTAKAYWKLEDGSKIIGEIYRKEHRKPKATRRNYSDEGIDIELVEKEIREKIFDKYTILPERLMALMGIDISPSNLDLTKARGANVNRKYILSAFSAVFKQLRLVDIVTKKRLKRIEALIDYSIMDDEMYYTAYDVVMDIFSLEEKLKGFFEQEDLCKETVRKFNEAISKAAYVNFEKFANGNTEAGEQL